MSTSVLVPRRRGPKPHPRIAQAKRTWYLLRRNKLALVGLGIILMIAGIAVYSATLPLPWSNVPIWCATDYGPQNSQSGSPGNFTQDCPTTAPIICTYEVTPPPNAARFCNGLWYPDIVRSNISFASIIAPTLSVSPLSFGPMPLGGLATSSGSRTPIYDVYTSLLRGSDWSLMFSVSIVGLGALVGLLVGAIAGFYGGILDETLMRIVDVFLSIPTILFVIVVVAVLSVDVPSGAGSTVIIKIVAMILGFTIVWWPFYARIVRGQVLTVREQKYVEAARASGARQRRILLRHIVPNSVFPVFIQFSLDVGTIPLLIGSLVFLGFGSLLFPSTPFPEWGSISAVSVSDLQLDFLTSCYTAATGCVIPWWQLLFPGLALFFFAISVNLLSDGLRDALDPRLRR
ncbi:MAG: ABC transporter permease [Thermoplasmata archaeon]